jgi:uncharacterized membrane protein
MKIYGPVLAITIIAVIAYALGWRPRSDPSRRGAADPEKADRTAIEDLKGRYATGALTRQEYDTLRDEI